MDFLSATRTPGAYSSPISGEGFACNETSATDCRPDIMLHEAGYLADRQDWNYPRVFSPFWRLYYDLEPGHAVIFDGRRLELGPDRLMLIPDHCLFHTAGDPPRPKFWLHFSQTRPISPHRIEPIILVPTAAETALIRELLPLFGAGDDATAQRRIRAGGQALLLLVLARPEIVWRPAKPAPLLQAIRHIERRFSDPLSNAELARLAGMSERSFTRQFIRCQGVSPRQFIMQVRVRAAADLMATTDASLDEIAEKTGFPNRAYLSRVFAKITGESPARFRRGTRRSKP